jgi:hypothetical protein
MAVMHNGLEYALQNGDAFHHKLNCSWHEDFTCFHRGGETSNITYGKMKLFPENLEKEEEEEDEEGIIAN